MVCFDSGTLYGSRHEARLMRPFIVDFVAFVFAAMSASSSRLYAWKVSFVVLCFAVEVLWSMSAIGPPGLGCTIRCMMRTVRENYENWAMHYKNVSSELR